MAVLRGDFLLAWRAGDPETSHSNTLLRDLDDALARAGVSLEEIELFAAASGPGSFTGLRIGLATTKGLAETLGRPCLGVPTLHAVASAAGPSEATVALLPAGRGEVFAQMFSVSSSGSVLELDEAAHLPPERMLDRYKLISRITWAGEGAHVQREAIKAYAELNGIAFNDYERAEQRPAGWILSPRQINLAYEVAVLALRRHERGETGDPHALRAIYVRPSDAELKQKCQ